MARSSSSSREEGGSGSESGDWQSAESEDEGEDGYKKGGYHRVAVGDVFKAGMELTHNGGAVGPFLP